MGAGSEVVGRDVMLLLGDRYDQLQHSILAVHCESLTKLSNINIGNYQSCGNITLLGNISLGNIIYSRILPQGNVGPRSGNIYI